MLKLGFSSLALQLFLLVAIGHLSGLVAPDFSDTNWDIVLFLTPYGIIKNHLVPSAISAFYGDQSPGQTKMEFFSGCAMGVLYFIALVNALLLLLRHKRLNTAGRN